MTCQHSQGCRSHRTENIGDGDDNKNEKDLQHSEKESVSIVTHQNLSPGGGVMDGEVTSSPGCSGMSVSAGEPGPCMPGGVDEVFRASVDEPLRETQEVSITRTPMLEINTYTESYMTKRKRCEVSGGSQERSGEKGMVRYLCIFLMLR